MQIDQFPAGVAEQLYWYVYRLIDPQNGETFYVGKGRGDRIFQHARGELKASEDTSDLKYQRIKAIRAAGLDVGHVIHRYCIETENIALQIEAALIDAYPGLTNRNSGHGSGDYGCRHVKEIIDEYSAEPFVAHEKLILISIGKTYSEEGRSVYDAVRAAWKINKNKAEGYSLVLAQCQGIVRGAFRSTRWMIGSKANFPWMPEDRLDRLGFEGTEAENETKTLYVNKRVPDGLRRRGAANPIRFVPKGVSTQLEDEDGLN